MSEGDEPPTPDPQLPQRPAPHRDPRNNIILLLSVLVAVLLGVVLWDRLPAVFQAGAAPPAGEPVTVLDVVLDRGELRFLDVVFDRPLGEGHVGDVLGRDPIVVTPSSGGAWRWRGANVLRLEPSGRFAPATEYGLALVADRLLGPGQAFAGKTSFTVRTDQFQVERVDIFEEPAPETGGVILRGEARFNYPVHPKVLATKMQLIDPLRGESSPVRLDIESSWADRIITFRSEPVLKQKAERQLRLLILSDLTPAEGNVPLPADHVQTIPLGSNEVLTLRSVEAQAGDPDSTIRLIFSSPISAEPAGGHLTLAPQAKHHLSSARNELTLTGAFQPGTEYELKLTQGLAGADGSMLKEAVINKVRIPDIEPSADFQSQGMFLSASGYRNVGVESVNVDQVELEVNRVFLNNLFVLFEYHSYQVFADSSWGFPGRRLGDVAAKETLRLAGRRNKRSVTPLHLDRWIPSGQPGLYRVALSRPDSHEARQRWVLITDLGIVAKVGAGECTVWVASFADLSPIAGAQVKLVSDQNQLMAQGRTDAAGVWRARGLGDLEEVTVPWMVTVEREGDFSFLLLDRAGIDTAGFDVGGARPPKGGYEAFMYGERDIYRPGETVEGLVVVRDRSLQPPPAMPLLIRHKDPQGQERGTSRLALDRRGLAPFRHEIPSYARTGRHVLEVMVAEEVIGQYRFQVEEFIPDRIKVEISPGRKEVGPAEQIAYDVAGAYLFGPPAAGLPVESRVRLAAAPFAPERYSAYTFEDPERRFEPREIAAFEGQALDEKGARSFHAQIPSGLRPPAALEAIVTARVQEQGGRGVSALQRLPVHPYPYYLGLRREGEGYPDPGRRVDFAWVAVAPAGAAAKAGPLRASLFHDRWQTVLRRTSEGTFRYESVRDSDLVETVPVTAGASEGALSFTPREHGAYRVVLGDAASGASTQVELYVSGWGYSPWAMKDPGRIELALDREEYRAGETATVAVKAPFPGKLIVAVETDRVLDTQVHTLSGNTAKISLPMRSEYRPNAYVTAVLVRSARDLEPGAAGRAFGAVPVMVDRAAHRLDVAIEGPDQVRPLTKLAVRVRGAPRAAVTVAAVDEGILQLIAQKTPDPFAWFYRKIRLGVRAYDIFSQLLPEVPPIAGGADTGGAEAMEGLAQFVRTEGIRRVEPVAFWSGVVETGADGSAQVIFDLPEFQGALRLMAVAHQADRFGSAERMIRVRSPLVLLPTFPRILSLEEKALIPITVRNDTQREGSFEVTLDAGGAARVEGDSALRLTMPHGAERTVHFTVATGGQPGEARLGVTAAGNGETASSTVSLEVRADLPAVTVQKSGSLQHAELALAADDLAGFRPGSVRREMRIGPLPLVQFSTRLRDLLHYPYGCLEQTVSSVFPLIYFGDLAKEWDPETFRVSEPAALVQAGIRRLGSMQLPGGGFGMWPGGDDLYPWGSVYATHFLVEARKAGYQVDSWLYDRALQFAAAEARPRDTFAFDEIQRVAYGLWVRARAGVPDVATMDFLRERKAQELKGESRAMLGAAYAAAGNARAASEMLAGVQDAQTPPRQTGGNLNSPARNRALLLLALLDAAPSDPRVAEVAQRLSREAEAQPWWSTQETAFVTLALGQLHRRQAARPAYSGTVFAGDRPLGAISAKTAVFRDIEGSEPIRVRMDAGYEPGAAFYSLLARGVPSDEVFRPGQSGLEIQRIFLDRAGAPLDPASVRQGDLIVVKTQVRSLSGRVDNVVVQNLLPSGLEVENPRLRSAETLPWISDADLEPEFLDIRDDRVLLFTDLPDDGWRTTYALLRAVTPGTFRLPPAQVEAMYDASLRATGQRGTIEVRLRE